MGEAIDDSFMFQIANVEFQISVGMTITRTPSGHFAHFKVIEGIYDPVYATHRTKEKSPRKIDVLHPTLDAGNRKIGK